MIGNKNAGDVRGLEEVFRSNEFGRATDAASDEEISLPGHLEDEAMIVREFGRPLSAIHVYEAGDEAEPSPSVSGVTARLGGTEAPEHPLLAPSSDGGAAGKEPPRAPAASAWNRHSTRYWTLACLSALAALVAAGVTAGSGPHRPSIAAQGAHGGAHAGAGRGGKYHTSGPAATGSTSASGTLAASTGSGVAGPGVAGSGAHGTGNAPGGHVSLIGAATFTGAPGGSASGGGGGAGATSPPPKASGNPIASTVTSTVSGAGAEVTTAASQVGSSVPAAGSAAAVVSNSVTAVDQAVSASPL